MYSEERRRRALYQHACETMISGTFIKDSLNHGSPKHDPDKTRALNEEERYLSLTPLRYEDPQGESGEKKERKEKGSVYCVYFKGENLFKEQAENDFKNLNEHYIFEKGYEKCALYIRSH